MEWHRLLVDDRMTEQPSATGAVFAYWVTHAFSRGELNADIQQVYRFLNDVFYGGMSSTAGWHMMMHEASWSGDAAYRPVRIWSNLVDFSYWRSVQQMWRSSDTYTAQHWVESLAAG